MNEIINILKNNTKTDEVIDITDTNFLYHGRYIPYFADSSPIISIIEKGLLTLKEQYENGIISLEDLKSSTSARKSILKFLKSKLNNGEPTQKEYRDNIVYFSPNRNLFNRVFDISFMVRKGPKYKLLEQTPNGYNIRPLTPNIEESNSQKLSNHDCVEYVTTSSVLPNEFVAIRINLDELLNPKSVEERGVSFEEIPSRIIKIVNDIYDGLEENNLNIPIINSNDGKVLNKEVFRELRKMFGYDININKAR